LELNFSIPSTFEKFCSPSSIQAVIRDYNIDFASKQTASKLLTWVKIQMVSRYRAVGLVCY